MDRRSFFSAIAGLFGAAAVTKDTEPVKQPTGWPGRPVLAVRYPYHKITYKQLAETIVQQMKAGATVRLPSDEWRIQEYRR